VDLPKLAALLADLAGVGALALSVYMFIVRQRAGRPRLRLSLERATVEAEYGDEPWQASPPEEMLFVDVVNPGDRRIKVPGLWIEYSQRRMPTPPRIRRDTYPHFFKAPKEPPFLLTPGDSAGFVTEFDEFKYWLSRRGLQGKVRVRIAIRDATGNWFRSKWLRLNLAT
jgi:hypothetical protein